MSIGPSMPLRLEKPEGIDLAQAARYFGARGGADAATQALLEKCAVPLLAAATPRAVRLSGSASSQTARQGKYLTGRYSPGYGDWPLAVQPLLAAALDTARRAGLCVTENNLMTPRKSITAILGVSDHPVRGHLAGCGHCVLRTRCEYRKRGITCASE